MGDVVHMHGVRTIGDASVTIAVKLCVRCRADKPMMEFRVDKRMRDGLRNQCRKCDSEIATKYNKEMRKDWAWRLIHNARISTAGGGNSKRQRKAGRRWEAVNITVEFLRELYNYQDGKCAYLNVPLMLDGGMSLRSITLDRLDCERGYAQGNVVLACRAANLARGNASTDDMHVLVEMIKRS